MTQQPLEQRPVSETDPLAYEKLKSAASQPERYKMFFGLLVAPVLMGSAWWLWHDPHTVKAIGWWIFCLASVVFGVTHVIGMRYIDRLKRVRMECNVTVRGLLGPFKKSAGVSYLYEKFSAQDFEDYRRAHWWGRILGFAVSALLGYGLTRFAFDMYIWP